MHSKSAYTANGNLTIKWRLVIDMSDLEAVLISSKSDSVHYFLYTGSVGAYHVYRVLSELYIVEYPNYQPVSNATFHPVNSIF